MHYRKYFATVSFLVVLLVFSKYISPEKELRLYADDREENFIGNIGFIIWKSIWDDRQNQFCLKLGKCTRIVVLGYLKFLGKRSKLSISGTALLFNRSKFIMRNETIGFRRNARANHENQFTLDPVSIVIEHDAFTEPPSYVSILTGNNTYANMVPIERIENGPSDGNGTAVCLHPIVDVGQHSSTNILRLIELFEYYKFIGISKIFIYKFYGNRFKLFKSTDAFLNFYSKNGFLNVMIGFQTKDGTFDPNWNDVNSVKPLHFTYCMLKNIKKFKYILVQDLDEAIAFPLKHKNISDWLNYLDSQYPNFSSYRFQDTRMELCDKLYKAPATCDAYTKNLVLSEYSKGQLLSFNKAFGKSIHKTNEQGCYLVSHHFCKINKKHSDSNPSTKRIPSTEGSIYHYRSPLITRGKLNRTFSNIELEDLKKKCRSSMPLTSKKTWILERLSKKFVKKLKTIFQEICEMH